MIEGGTLDLSVGVHGHELVAALHEPPVEEVVRVLDERRGLGKSRREILESRGADVVQGTPEDFLNFVKNEIAKFAPVIKRTGVQVE